MRNWSTIGAINNADTAVDQRIGGRFYPGVTDKSGQRPGTYDWANYNENKSLNR